jgi:hypothetical protein
LGGVPSSVYAQNSRPTPPAAVAPHHTLLCQTQQASLSVGHLVRPSDRSRPVRQMMPLIPQLHSLGTHSRYLEGSHRRHMLLGRGWCGRRHGRKCRRRGRTGGSGLKRREVGGRRVGCSIGPWRPRWGKLCAGRGGDECF